MTTMNINRVVLTGNLTEDPELRSTPDGSRLQFARRVQRPTQGRSEWRMDRKAQLFDVTVFGAQGQNAARYLTKAGRRHRTSRSDPATGSAAYREGCRINHPQIRCVDP